MIMRGELPRNTGTDGDGVAQTESDHFEKCCVCARGLICAISPKSLSTSMTTARLK
jgi:hypothetical protein